MIWWIWIRKKYSLHKRKSKTDTSSRSSNEWHQVRPDTRNRRGKIRNIFPTLGSRKNKHEIYNQLKQNLKQNQLEFCSIFSPNRFISVDDVDWYHHSLTLSDSISPTPTKTQKCQNMMLQNRIKKAYRISLCSIPFLSVNGLLRGMQSSLLASRPTLPTGG